MIKCWSVNQTLSQHASTTNAVEPLHNRLRDGMLTQLRYKKNSCDRPVSVAYIQELGIAKIRNHKYDSDDLNMIRSRRTNLLSCPTGGSILQDFSVYASGRNEELKKLHPTEKP